MIEVVSHRRESASTWPAQRSRGNRSGNINPISINKIIVGIMGIRTCSQKYCVVMAQHGRRDPGPRDVPNLTLLSNQIPLDPSIIPCPMCQAANRQTALVSRRQRMIQPFEQGSKVTTIPPKSTGDKVESEKEIGNRHDRLRSVKAICSKKDPAFLPSIP